MFKTDLIRTATALLCTLLVSTACVIGAVGPAQPGAGQAVVTMAARFVA